MYIKIKAYNDIKPQTEDFDTIPLSSTGPESESLKEGMYSYDSEFEFEILYEQLEHLRDRILEIVGENKILERIDVDRIIGPRECKEIRTLLRKKAVLIVDPNREDDMFIFAFSHFMMALDTAVHKRGVILFK